MICLSKPCRCFLLLFLLPLSTHAAEYVYVATECNAVGYECKVRPVDSSFIDAGDWEFAELSRKVKTIDSSYSLVNSGLLNLPRTRLLKTIAGVGRVSQTRPPKVTSNQELIYNGELDRLERVTGPIVIQNNPRFRIPLSLYQQFCQYREGSTCDVDVTCKGNIFIAEKTLFPEAYSKCTVLYGDIVVVGLTEQKNALYIRYVPFNIHTVYGVVRMAYNEVASFEFLKSIRRIEYPYEAGCALSVLSNQGLKRIGMDNLEEIALPSNNTAANAFCILKNRMAGENRYYIVDSDAGDRKVFSKLKVSAKFEVDHESGAFDWDKMNDTKEPSIVTLTVATGVMAGIVVLAYVFWGLDWYFELLFYKSSTTESEVQGTSSQSNR